MDAHEVEPITLLGTGLEEPDLAISKGPEQALVTDVAHTIKSKLRATFLQEYRFDGNFVGFRHTTIIIDQSCHLKQIQCRVMLLTLSSGIIMISMNRENRNGNIDILILIIDMIEWSMCISVIESFPRRSVLTARSPQWHHSTSPTHRAYHRDNSPAECASRETYLLY